MVENAGIKMSVYNAISQGLNREEIFWYVVEDMNLTLAREQDMLWDIIDEIYC
jgi:hypothetical protein